jgi:hypothetical protein
MRRTKQSLPPLYESEISSKLSGNDACQPLPSANPGRSFQRS